jgi:hypothetical protein
MSINKIIALFACGIAFNASLLQAQTTRPAAPPAKPAATPAAAPAATPDKPPMTAAEIEAVVAPIALYPDSLLSQILMASTYPLEIVQAQRWAKANSKLSGDALAKELETQPWDPSVKSLVQFTQVLDMLSEKLDATVKLGDAFIDDQKAVLDAVQRLRAKAKNQGNLETTKEQTIIVEQAPETKIEVIRIEPSNPQVVYVPTYNPTVVYGSWPYPAYPPYSYPPPSGYWTGAAVGFGTGLALGAAWGYAWGHCNWGGGNCDIDVNRNTNFNQAINRNNYQNKINQTSRNRTAGDKTFNHDPSHRQGVAYRDQRTNQKFGGSSNQAIQSRDAYRGRADAGRADINRGGASEFRGAGSPSVSDRSRVGGSPSVSDRSRGTGSPSFSDRSRTGGSPSVSDRSRATPGANRGSPSYSRPSSGSNGLGSVGSSGSSARSASQRGSASRSASSPSRSYSAPRSSGGGGGFRGGGGGGGGRGGGRR